MGGGDRPGGLLGAVQWARHDGGDVEVGEVLRGDFGLAVPVVGQAEAGQPTVEHLARVEHLTVADQMHPGAPVQGRHDAPPAATGVAGVASGTAAAARAAAGAAAAIRSSTTSSWAAETNQASNADGGR